ncbi:MAG TPA: metallophosphoesterase [Myxococcota bacterium]|nr:metallophosphoesterase [Myxococcota bacterium]
MIRVAAVGDLHIGDDGSARWRDALKSVSDEADLLLLAGDLTRVGTVAEGLAVVTALELVSVPIVAVLGNHDYHDGCDAELRRILATRGARVLEGTTATLEVGGARIGIAGSKGFGGGFANACGSDFGEPEMKAFIRHTAGLAGRLRRALASLDVDLRVALLHYSPVPGTLRGEQLQIYPFLGSYLLGEAVDAAGADLVLHGHAHAGSEKGITPGGVCVRNVAQPVIGSAYRVYCLSGRGEVECAERAAHGG